MLNFTTLLEDEQLNFAPGVLGVQGDLDLSISLTSQSTVISRHSNAIQTKLSSLYLSITGGGYVRGHGNSVSFLSEQDLSLLGLTQEVGTKYNFSPSETPLQAVQDCDDRFGQSWYGLTVINATDDQGVDVAKYIESSTNKHLFGVTTQDTSTLAVDPNSATIASQLKALNLKRTFVQYSSSSPYAVCSAFGRLLTTDYNANNSVITLMYKNEPTVTAEYLTSTQITNLEAKNCNVFVAYNNGTAIIEPGVVSSGDFVDTISNVDWLATQIQTSVYNLLYTSKTKIPQTDSGNHLIASVISSVCAQAQTNGICAPGVWTSNGFGGLKYNDFMPTGYYVYAPPISSQLLADRNARKSVSFQVALKLAGAIHSVKISVNVNH